MAGTAIAAAACCSTDNVSAATAAVEAPAEACWMRLLSPLSDTQYLQYMSNTPLPPQQHEATWPCQGTADSGWRGAQQVCGFALGGTGRDRKAEISQSTTAAGQGGGMRRQASYNKACSVSATWVARRVETVKLRSSRRTSNKEGDLGVLDGR